MKLTVRPLKQKDAGRGLAALDPRAAEELGVDSGDYIVIEGKENRAVARVWPGYPEDQGQGVIRIDGRLRQEAGAGIDDRVEVETADVKPAESITVALPQNLRIQGNIGPLIRDRL
ncbi:MAG: AAA family ATPase, partial [Haloarculaceae archaeon]